MSNFDWNAVPIDRFILAYQILVAYDSGLLQEEEIVPPVELSDDAIEFTY